MRISAVIPNFNGAKLLRNNLPKIMSALGDAEVIVIDDASTDDSKDLLRKYFPKVKVITRKINEGFSSTVNDGVKYASHDYILLLNNDVIPEPDFIKHLLPYFQDPKVFAVGCLQKTNTLQGTKQEGRGVGHFEKGFLVHRAGELDKSDTLWVFGGAGMFRKTIWNKLGGMDTIYNPFYWEDIDLSYRAKKAGFKLVFEPKSVVVHNQEKGAIRNNYKPEQIKTIAYRNQILFIWANITDTDELLKHLIFLPCHLLGAILRLDFPFHKAFLMAILRMPQVIRSRIRNKRTAQIPDSLITVLK